MVENGYSFTTEQTSYVLACVNYPGFNCSILIMWTEKDRLGKEDD